MAKTWLGWEDVEPHLKGGLRDLFLLLCDHFPQFSGDNIDLIGPAYSVVETMRWTVPAVQQEYWEKVMLRAPMPLVSSILFTSSGVQLDFDRARIYPMGLLHVDWRVIIEHWWGG